MPEEYYAHSLEGRSLEEWQPLDDHLNNVAEKAVEFAKPFGGEDWCRTFEKDYAAIIVNEVDDLAKKYLNNPHAATLVIVPDSQNNAQNRSAEDAESSVTIEK